MRHLTTLVLLLLIIGLFSCEKKEEQKEPVAIFTVSPTSGPFTTVFTFDASEVYNEGESTESLKVRWDWEGDGEFDTPYSENKIQSHRYDGPGDYNAVRGLRTLEETIRCPKCGSTLVAALHPNNIQVAAIVKKKLTKRDLSPDEEREWQRAWLNAGLVQTYGKRALRALVARGVGPTTAVRILRRYHRTENDFYMDLIRAERDYARTRMFWDR